jgi:pimeloyl-ACP methyl ester carboxylesterase
VRTPRSFLLLLGAILAITAGLALRSPSSTSAMLMWTGCPENDAWECSTLLVPLDYDAPDGEFIELGIARLPATNQEEKIGPLFINFGGPGVPAILIARDFGWGEALDPAILAKFDIVAVDPRGVGESTPVVCNENIQDWYGLDGTPDNDEEWEAIKSLAQTIADECAQNGDILAHIGTYDVVRDFEQVRSALAADQATYFGYSYGTTIGQVYADHPNQRCKNHS